MTRISSKLRQISFKYRARTSIMGKIPNTNIYESIDACEDVSLNLINIVFDIKIIFSSFF